VNTLVLSDVHIGDINSKYESLFAFLDSQRGQAERIIILGDLVDFWKARVGRIVNQSIELLKLIRKEFQVVIYVVGNHDEDISQFTDLFPETFCLFYKMETPAGHTYLTHGHQFDQLLLSGVRRAQILAWLEGKADQYFGLDIRKFLYSLSKTTHMNLYPKMVDEIEAAALEYCKANTYDCVIMGHTHSPTFWVKEGISYYNIGDWVQHKTALKITDTEMTLLSFDSGEVKPFAIDRSWKSAAERSR
jgi:UDP-2,3-diacylglucosamine pyrophosphatase LpxH